LHLNDACADLRGPAPEVARSDVGPKRCGCASLRSGAGVQSGAAGGGEVRVCAAKVRGRRFAVRCRRWEGRARRFCVPSCAFKSLQKKAPTPDEPAKGGPKREDSGPG